MSIEKVK